MSDLEPIQRSRLGEIGQLLAKARAEKGLTLEEVSGKTLIRAAILKAIEEGDARPLPEPVYIRGFIRRFGDLVGLNGMELCDSFPWQPSGSVPLSFVSAGNIVAANSAEQKPAESAVVETPTPSVAEPPEPKAEPSAVEAPEDLTPNAVPGVEPAVASASNVDALEGAAISDSHDSSVESSERTDPQAPEVVTPKLAAPVATDSQVAAAAESEVPMALSEVAPQEAAPLEQAVVEEPAAVVEPAVPDHEAAYESRAALFGGDEETGDVAAAGTAIAATGAAVTSSAALSNAETATASGESVTQAPANAGGSGVATMPPPPAPVMYREPEKRNLVPWLLALVLGAVALGIGVLAFGGNRQTAPVANDSTAVEQVETPEGDAATGDSSEAATTPDAAEPTQPAAAVPADKVVLELEVKGTEDAWMDVRVDGELQIEGNQAPGFKQRWEGDQEIDFATARPDMVWISVNGGEPKAFGQLAEARPVKVEVFKPANAQ